ncbi:MAG: hypothetical protein HYU36_20525 [Planctomycetes bacterium]|nr:hypothetical protein [Planctomycetota bacterium]
MFSLFGPAVATKPIDAAEWKLALEEGFDDPGWQGRWELKGSLGPTDQKALLSNDGEARKISQDG